MDVRLPDTAPPSIGLRATLLPAQAGQALTFVLLAPVVPAIAAFFGGGASGDAAAQLVVVFPFLGLFGGGLASGWAIRALGLRTLILLAAGAFALSGAIGLFAPSMRLLLVGCALLGLGAAFLTSGLSAVTSIVYRGEALGRTVGQQSAIANTVSVLLGLSSAFLAERMGWRTPFGFCLGYGTAMLVLSLLFIPSTTRNDRARPASMRWVATRVWPLCLAGAAIFAIATTQSTHLPFLLAQNGIGSAGLRAVVTTFTTAFGVLGSLGFSALQGRLAERTLVLIAGLIAVAGWIAFGLWTGGLATPFVAAALLGIAIGMVLPMLYGGAMRLAPGEASGQAVGLLNAALFLGSFANPLLTAPLRAMAGLSGIMFVVAALTMGIVLVAMGWPRRGVPARGSMA